MVLVNAEQSAAGLSKLLITKHLVATRLFIYMENDGDDDDDDDGADFSLQNTKPGYLDGLGDAVEQGAGPSEGCWCLKLQSFNLSLTASSSSFASISAYSNPELSVSSIRAINMYIYLSRSSQTSLSHLWMSPDRGFSKLNTNGSRCSRTSLSGCEEMQIKLRIFLAKTDRVEGHSCRTYGVVPDRTANLVQVDVSGICRA
ncbi:hypothetical protein V6N13_127402 [Hibiscus sabdariffa]